MPDGEVGVGALRQQCTQGSMAPGYCQGWHYNRPQYDLLSQDGLQYGPSQTMWQCGLSFQDGLPSEDGCKMDLGHMD